VWVSTICGCATESSLQSLPADVKCELQELLLSSGTLTWLTQQFVVALATSDWFEAPCDPLSRFYLGLRPTVMVVDPEMIKQITVKEFSSFMDREVSHGNMNMGSSLCRGP